MMKMLIFFVIVSFFLNVARGLKTCPGPYELPELKEITTTIADKNNMQSATVTLHVVSKVPVHIVWWLTKPGNADYVVATEDNNDFKSSVEVSGDRHVFKLRAMISSDVRNITKFFDRRVYVDIAITYNCNYLRIPFRLSKLIDLVNRRVKLPIITELPQQRYFIEDEGRHTIRLGFTNEDGSSPDVTANCRSSYTRSDGKVMLPDYRDYNGVRLNSSTIDSGRGSAVATCQLDFTKDEESRGATLSAAVRIEAVKGSNGYDHNSIDFEIMSELRRPGVVIPSITVYNQFGNVLKRSSGGDLVLPTANDTTVFMCLADAEKKPHVAAARRDTKGDFDLLKEDYPENDFSSASTSWARFTAKSPPAPLDEDEYICSAGSGSNVVSQTFKVKRFVGVRIKPTGSITMQEGQNKTYDLRCEATGTPTPEIRFYVSPSMNFFNDDYLILNKNSEIHDSDLFETATWNEGGTAYGKLVVKNFDNVIANLPDNFWEQHFSYILVCYAFNDFNDGSQMLASYTSPDQFGGGPMNATYIYNYSGY